MKKSFSTLLFTLVVLAVQAKEIKPQDETIADTYWRNEATGDWFIGFAPKHVIYNNKQSFIFLRWFTKATVYEK